MTKNIIILYVIILFFIKTNLSKPKKDWQINNKFTELSPLFLLTKIEGVSPIFKFFILICSKISDNTINPSPIFPQYLVISFTDLFEYILYPLV